ncbi:hypothetical protein CPT_Pascal49 [Bacillus phage Pascal]|uniref:Uncharacterized protein n=1 Tax=Bacillus phage Pascal TaxID=1540092 RepID=A0A0A0RPX0_9CAUD|nr:hypothetical protein CPT_Pascal49 [Bacillus phage Pascal]AIW03684.1 hypothetical protein CPT_Pascal49 [Bacillus phage Pascal]
MKLTFDINKILVLDTPFKPDMLKDKHAVLGEIEGKGVLMFNVDYEEVHKQVMEQQKEGENK